MKSIQFVRGNLLDAPYPIIHGCNARGAFGRGVAGAIRKRWPPTHEAYTYAIREMGVGLGNVVWCQVYMGNKRADVLVGHCITQASYGAKGMHVDYEALETCLKAVDGHDHPFLESTMCIAMPKIGAGLGGGDWKLIEAIIERSFKRLQPVVYILKSDESIQADRQYILQRLRDLFELTDAETWMTSPQELLGGLTAEQMIERDESNQVLQLIDDAKNC